MLPVLLALTYSHFFAAAQEPSLAYGDTVTGTIGESGDADAWTFDGTRNDVITLHVTRQSGDLIPAIELDDADGQTLMRLDWPDQGPPEVVFTVRLRTTGTHAVTIRGHGATSGQYALTLTLQTPGAPTSGQEGVLAYGDTVSGTISDSTFREFWSFRGTRGDVIDVVMTAASGDLDAYLMLLSPQGDILLSSDTGGPGRDAGLFAFRLPTSGTYSLVARRAGANEGERGTTRGMYALALTLRRPGVDDSAIIPARLVLGMPMRGRLNADAPTALYSVDSSGVLSLALTATDPAQVATVTVMTPSRALVGTFSGVSPMRSSVALPGEGLVWIEVSATNIQETDPVDFSLTVHQLTTAQRTSRALQYGRAQIVDATPDQPDAWHFYGDAGDLITVDVAPFGTLFEGSVRFFSPTGDLLLERTINGGVLQPLALQTSGIYEIVMDAQPDDHTYRIGVERSGINNVAFAQHAVPVEQGFLLPATNRTVSGTVGPGESASWVMDVAGPQVWRFELAQTRLASPVVLAVQAPGGEHLAAAITDVVTSTARLQIELPAIGRYQLLVFDLSGEDNHDYTLRGEPVEGGSLFENVPAKGVLDGASTYDVWTVNALADALLNVHIDTVTDSSPPAIHVIKPDGLLAASTTQGTLAPSDLTGIATARGGLFRVIVSQSPGSDRLVYRITVNASEPFGVETTLTTAALPVAGDVTPAPIQRRVVIPDIITPAVDTDAPYWQAAQPIEPESLVRGEVKAGTLYQAWTFTANSGQVYGMSVVALDGDARPGMMLLDQDGAVLAQSFDPADSSNYLMYRFATSATFRLVISLNAGGRYNLWITPLTGINDTLPVVLPGQAMSYGQTVTGELLDPGDSRLYVFYGRSGDTITARAVVTQGSIAPTISLATANGDVLAEERIPDAAASIAGYTLPANGLFQLRIALGASSAGKGRFALNLMLHQAQQPTGMAGGLLKSRHVAALRVNDATHRWLFSAESGERITLRVAPLSAEVPQPLRLQVADSAGNVFLEKETRPGQRTLVLSNIMLPRSGVYQAVVSGGQRQTGLYEIVFERGSDSLYDEDRAIRYGDTVGKVLTAGNFLDVWTFAGTSGDVVTVSARPVRGDETFISLQLRTDAGEILATIAADDTTRVARIEHVTLPSNGHYSVIVGNVDGAFQGETAYELTARLENTGARSIGTVMTCGQVAEGTFHADDATDVWLFEGIQGDVITATLIGLTPGVTPVLRLASTDWRTASAIGQADILGEAQGLDGEAAQITQVLPTSAPYALVVSDPAQRSGNYRLELVKADVLPFPSQPIRTDQERSGEIGVTVPYEAWTFTGLAGSQVTIVVEPDSRSALAPAIRLVNSAGQDLAQAEAASGDSARVDDYQLPASDTYSVLVTRALEEDGRSNGRYVVTLHETVAANTTYPAITFGERVRGVLDSSAPANRVEFEGTQGDIVEITAEATSGNLDPLVMLYGPDGTLLATGDDEQDLDATIDAELPETGVYTVEIRRYAGSQGTTSGNYVLSVLPVYRAGDIMPERLMAYGDQVSGATDGTTHSDVWSFVGEKHDVISAAVQFPLDDAPLMLMLLDPAGNTLATGERSGGDAFLEAFTLPASGYYTLEVRRPGDARARFSPYTLRLDLLSTTYQTPAQGGVLVPGQAAVGQFVQPAIPHSWFFAGEAGQSLSFSLNWLSGELAVTLAVVAPDGNTLLTSTSPTSLISTLATGPITLPLDGTYLVIVTDHAATLGTVYRLFIQPAEVFDADAREIDLLQDGFGTITDVQPREEWRFDAYAGDSLSLRVTALDGDLQPTLMLWDANGRPLMEGLPDSSGETAQVSLSNALIAESGTYRVTVSRPGGAAGSTTGSYRLLLRRHPISVRAALATDIAFDTEINGFAGANPGLFAFNGLAGDIIAVSARMWSGNSVPRLALEDERGMRLDAPVVTTDGETSVSAFVLPEDGRYVLVLSGNAGTYTLAVCRRSRDLPDGGLMRNLGRGQTFAEGINDPAVPTHWQFSAQAGEVLAFTVDTSNGGLRADVTLYGPRGVIANAVEAPGSRLTTVGPLRLPDDGDYVLVVGPWMGRTGGTTGRYSVRVETQGPDVSGSDGGHIAARKRTVTGGLVTFDDQDIWTFDGTAGEVITVRADRLPGPGTFRLTLTAPDGTELAAGEPDASIRSLLLPETGVYTVSVTGQLDGEDAVEYRLAIADVQSPVSASLRAAAGITVGDQKEGALSHALRYEAWVFFGRAGEQIASLVQPANETLAPELYVVGPGGEVLFAASNPVEGGSAVVSGLALPHTGFYGLVVGSRVAGEYQPYTITLDRQDAGASDRGRLDDQAAGTLTQAVPAHEWTVQPAYSGDYLLRVSSLAVGETPHLFVVSASDDLLATGTADDQGTVRALAYLSAGQTYTAVVSGGPAITQGTYAITLEPASSATNGGDLSPDEPNVGRITDERFSDEWRIKAASAGSVTVNIIRTAGDLIAELTLYDINGLRVQRETAADDGALQATFALPAEGSYRFIVSRVDGGAGQTEGDYAITIRNEP